MLVLARERAFADLGLEYEAVSTNLDLVRSIYAAWERGDFGSAEWADPGIEFVWADGPEPGSHKGQGAMAKTMRDWLSAWADLRQEPEEYRELDHERVMVLHRFSASGKASGLDLGQMRRRARPCSTSAAAK